MSDCLHLNHRLARAGTSNGVGMWCTDCDRWVTAILGLHRSWALPKSHPLLVGVNRDTLPRVNGWSCACDICEKETQTPELHHWCPQALYKKEPPANGGPQAWLCKECHATWHHMVTPGLLADDALELVRSLYRRFKRRPGAWDNFVRAVNHADAVTRLPMPPRREAA